MDSQKSSRMLIVIFSVQGGKDSWEKEKKGTDNWTVVKERNISICLDLM